MENINRNFDDFNPEIEFGLAWQYDMKAELRIEIPLDFSRSCDYSPLTGYIDPKVYDFIGRTHDSHRRQGYFTAPFMVCCVLRGHDNSHLFISQPRLMTAGLLPPCLNFYDLTDGNRRDLYFRLTGSPVFSLMIHIGELPDDLAAKVGYVDVYVTRQIPAYSYGGGRYCDYSDVLRDIDADSPIHDGVDLGHSVLMCKGRYSDSELLPEFERHYNDSKFARNNVWYVAPNNSLADMLAAETGFHHVASIEAGSIIGRQSFQTVYIPTTENEWIEYHGLPEDEQTKQEETPPSADTRPHNTPTQEPHKEQSKEPPHYLRYSPQIYAPVRLSPGVLHVRLPHSRLRLNHSSGLSPPKSRCPHFYHTPLILPAPG